MQFRILSSTWNLESRICREVFLYEMQAQRFYGETRCPLLTEKLLYLMFANRDCIFILKTMILLV